MIFIMALNINYIYSKIRILTVNIKDILEGKVTNSLVKYDEGDYGKLFFAFQDVRKRLKDNIETLDNEKKFLINILSDISHQLKTPLAALKMYNEILIILENQIEMLHDRKWLSEALINIIKNDIEHTGQGGKIDILLEDNSVYTKIIIEANGGIVEVESEVGKGTKFILTFLRY